jgi:hypothetical protein
MEDKTEISNFWCVLAALLGTVQNFHACRSPCLFGVDQHCKMESREMDKRNSKTYGSLGMEEKHRNFEGSNECKSTSKWRLAAAMANSAPW